MIYKMECMISLARHVNQCEVRREKYNLPDLVKRRIVSNESYVYPALREPPIFTEPSECTWAFMNEKDVESLLMKKNLDQVKALIDKTLSHGYPKGLPRMVASELLYTAYKFAKNSCYGTKQTGALLSMCYLTHRYFNSCHRTTAEDVYWFFKELLCYHSLEFVPSHTMIFGAEEASLLLNYFCKLFLRHLPIIRLLGLPNFQFAINSNVPPFPVFKKKKSKKEKGPKTSKKGKKHPKAKKHKKK